MVGEEEDKEDDMELHDAAAVAQAEGNDEDMGGEKE